MFEFEKFFQLEFDPVEGIVVLAINKVNDKYNTFSRELVLALELLLKQYNSDERVRALILTGGERVFSTGADILGEFKNLDSSGARKFSDIGQRVFELLELVDFITLAAINGFALGGGLEICLACDFRFASTRARFGLPEINLALIPGWGGTQRLARIIGKDKAMQMIFSGDPINTDQALQYGLITKICESDKLLSEAKTFLTKFTKKDRHAIATAKRAIVKGASQPMSEALSLESELFGLVWSSEEREKAIEEFFKKNKSGR